MEAYSLLIIALGVCLLVLQFYIDYELFGLDKYINKKNEKEIIENYYYKKDNVTITFLEKCDLKFRAFFRSKILYKVGAILICIGIILNIL